MLILDPTFFHPGSRIRIKEFNYFNPKKWFLSSRKYDLGCSSRIQGSKWHRNPDPDPQHWFHDLHMNCCVSLVSPVAGGGEADG
jgi:hypothetical protein